MLPSPLTRSSDGHAHHSGAAVGVWIARHGRSVSRAGCRDLPPHHHRALDFPNGLPTRSGMGKQRIATSVRSNSERRQPSRIRFHLDVQRTPNGLWIPKGPSTRRRESTRPASDVEIYIQHQHVFPQHPNGFQEFKRIVRETVEKNTPQMQNVLRHLTSGLVDATYPTHVKTQSSHPSLLSPELRSTILPSTDRWLLFRRGP
jgi:hypothetical protein